MLLRRILKKERIMSIKVYDNFLAKDDFESIQGLVMSHHFPWYYYDSAVTYDSNKECRDYQLAHVLYYKDQVQSTYFNAIAPLLNALDIFTLVKVKMNLNTYSGNIHFEHGYHTDYNSPVKMKTAVYYLNTNNGYTKFKKENEKIYSYENRLVEFDSNELHTGSAPTDAKARFVINLNYIKN